MSDVMTNGKVLDREATINEITKLEWDMFSAVKNVGGPAGCQSQRKTFEIMRKAQHQMWGDDTLETYKMDLLTATLNGDNLMTYKYGYMMKSTFPQEYEQIKDQLPEIGSARRKLVTWLTEQHNEWTKEAAAKYPKLCAWGRPLDEQAANGSTWASVENYFYCELLTYSTATLQWCKRDFEECLEAGENPVLGVLTYIAECYGYTKLEDIEAALQKVTPDNLV